MAAEGTAKRDGPVDPSCGGEQDAWDQSDLEWDAGKLVEQEEEDWAGQQDALSEQTFEKHGRSGPLSGFYPERDTPRIHRISILFDQKTEKFW